MIRIELAFAIHPDVTCCGITKPQLVRADLVAPGARPYRGAPGEECGPVGTSAVTTSKWKAVSRYLPLREKAKHLKHVARSFDLGFER